MRHSLNVENLQCYGCAEAIEQAVAWIPGVAKVQVDVANRAVWFEAPKELVARVSRVLLRLGYPVAGTVDSVERVVASVRALGSCELGRKSGHHGTPFAQPPADPPGRTAPPASTAADPDEVVVLDDGAE